MMIFIEKLVLILVKKEIALKPSWKPIFAYHVFMFAENKFELNPRTHTNILIHPFLLSSYTGALGGVCG